MESDDLVNMKGNLYMKDKERLLKDKLTEEQDIEYDEEPLSYDGYELEDLSDMDREEPCI